MMKSTAALSALGGAMFMAASAVPASALECRGAMAYNSAAGGYIENTICGDKLIAKVAGKPFNGPNGVRQNPSVKKEACMFAGHDIRISHLCAGLKPEDFGGGRRN